MAADDQSGARALLDWLREDLHLEGGDDPLATTPFSRIWIKGKEASAAKIKLAAAAILAVSKVTAERAISILEPAYGSVSDDNDKANIALALTYAYSCLEKNDKGVVIASRLHEQYPESAAAFIWHAIFLRALGRWSESDALAQMRLRVFPGDVEALHQMMFNANAHEDFSSARAIAQEIVKEGKGTAWEQNVIAWNDLFLGKPTESDIDAALKAVQLSDRNWSYMHTLACLYAEIGKLKEADEILVQAMDSANFDDPNSSFWYAFGRLAEQAGELDSARADYARVEVPTYRSDISGSSYQLTQIHLKELQKQAK
jgi:tetratricopeptide (TPR) repeat protein